MVANCSEVRENLEKLLCVRQIQILGYGSREARRLEAPFSCAIGPYIDLRRVV